MATQQFTRITSRARTKSSHTTPLSKVIVSARVWPDDFMDAKTIRQLRRQAASLVSEYELSSGTWHPCGTWNPCD